MFAVAFRVDVRACWGKRICDENCNRKLTLNVDIIGNSFEFKAQNGSQGGTFPKSQ